MQHPNQAKLVREGGSGGSREDFFPVQTLQVRKRGVEKGKPLRAPSALVADTGSSRGD